MGDAEVVVAEAGNDAAAAALSAFAHGLHAAGRVAIVRFVKKENADARLGYLSPFNLKDRSCGSSIGNSSSSSSSSSSSISSSSSSSSSSSNTSIAFSGKAVKTEGAQMKMNGGCEALVFVALPFKEDDRRWKFEALGKAKGAAGEVTRESGGGGGGSGSSETPGTKGSRANAARARKLLPTREQCAAADDLVSALDLDSLPGQKGLESIPSNPSQARFFSLLRRRAEAEVEACGEGTSEDNAESIPFSFPLPQADPFAVFDQKDAIFSAPAALAARARFAAASSLVRHLPRTKGTHKAKKYFAMDWDLDGEKGSDDDGRGRKG